MNLSLKASTTAALTNGSVRALVASPVVTAFCWHDVCELKLLFGILFKARSNSEHIWQKLTKIPKFSSFGKFDYLF